MICKIISVELIDGQVEEFRDVEWNDSLVGVSLCGQSPDGEEKRIFFYPLSSILKVKAIV